MAACYETGACGSPKDMEKAKEIYRRTCDTGFRQSCARLQQMQEDNESWSEPGDCNFERWLLPLRHRSRVNVSFLLGVSAVNFFFPRATRYPLPDTSPWPRASGYVY